MYIALRSRAPLHTRKQIQVPGPVVGDDLMANLVINFSFSSSKNTQHVPGYRSNTDTTSTSQHWNTQLRVLERIPHAL
jgi:hypothetical protein